MGLETTLHISVCSYPWLLCPFCILYWALTKPSLKMCTAHFFTNLKTSLPWKDHELNLISSSIFLFSLLHLLEHFLFLVLFESLSIFSSINLHHGRNTSWLWLSTYCILKFTTRDFKSYPHIYVNKFIKNNLNCSSKSHHMCFFV